ncbi:hypothetical protein Goarm_001104 [Gossypium armourianum]|uniref:Uncharacterized protein n=1 Tax=Gossypium armourianum TaxID=34283 RepID=A0A7J9KBY1_9ROSI|nr:hypothetical protein [Gossypium armourianum]
MFGFKGITCMFHVIHGILVLFLMGLLKGKCL